MKSSFALACAALILCLSSGPIAAGQSRQPAGARTSPAEIAHARALDSFRRARFPEAYGRFVQLANSGHAPSARIALWMCEQGSAVFGSDWDCTPDEIEDWQALSRVKPDSSALAIASPASSRNYSRSRAREAVAR